MIFSRYVASLSNLSWRFSHCLAILSSPSATSPNISQTLFSPCLWVMMVGMGPALPKTIATSVCRRAVTEWGCWTATSSVGGTKVSVRTVRARELVALLTVCSVDGAGRSIRVRETIASSGVCEASGAVSQL